MGKRHFTTAALAVVRALTDPVEQEHYMQKIAQYTKTSLDAVQEKLYAEPAQPEASLRPVHIQQDTAQPDPAAHQDALLALMLTDPSARDLLGELTAEMLATDERRAVLQYVRESTEKVDGVPKELQDYDIYVKILLLKADTRTEQHADSDRQFEAAELVRRIITEHKNTQKTALIEALRIAEDTGDEAEATRLRQAVNEYIKETPRAKR